MRKVIKGIKGLSLLLNPKTWGPFSEIASITKFDHAFSVSWSQGGEDLGLLSALMNVENGRYLDIGAHHPNRFSVTRHLYQRGWSGVNVDANSDLIPEFNKKRPRDRNIWSCVGLNDSYIFHIFDEPAISTMNVEWRERFIQENQTIRKSIEVPGITLKALLEKDFTSRPCDLLTIDAEGADFEVLRSGLFEENPSLMPQWLLLEADPPVTHALSTSSVQYAIELGYEPWLVLTMSTLLRKRVPTK